MGTMGADVRRFRFLLRAHPLWPLAEAWVLGIALLFLTSRVTGTARPALFQNGTLMLCGTCGMWVVVRTRLPGGSVRRQMLYELGVAAGLSMVMALGLRLSTTLLGWSAVWGRSKLAQDLVTLLLALTGAGYLGARLLVRLWRYWDRVRRGRMVLSLTHAHLMLALGVMLAAILFGATYILLQRPQADTASEPQGLLDTVADRLFLTLVPLAGIYTILALGALVVLLPPSAAFSYWVARRTTRRLDDLAHTARAVREGAYDARVAVEGEDEVAQLQADFNAMAERLEQTLRDLEQERDAVSQLLVSRRQLVASVSHELRTPVATVRATLESVLDRQQTALAPALRHDLEVMQGEIERLQRLIDDLFALSQAETGQLALDLGRVDILPLVQRIVDAVAPLAWEASRVQVVAELSEIIPPARVDPSRLEQVLANLLRNGVRHTPPGGIVAVMAATEGDWVRVDVRDTGEGIPPQELPHIWERFFRGEQARAEDRRGAGLGLALVKELTEAMGGNVAVESTLGKGSSFTVRVPRA
jgi:signal transduction histidine kinase